MAFGDGFRRESEVLRCHGAGSLLSAGAYRSPRYGAKGLFVEIRRDQAAEGRAASASGPPLRPRRAYRAAASVIKSRMRCVGAGLPLDGRCSRTPRARARQCGRAEVEPSSLRCELGALFSLGGGIGWPSGAHDRHTLLTQAPATASARRPSMAPPCSRCRWSGRRAPRDVAGSRKVSSASTCSSSSGFPGDRARTPFTSS
jgi:hypothetical protein